MWWGPSALRSRYDGAEKSFRGQKLSQTNTGERKWGGGQVRCGARDARYDDAE